MSIIDVMQERYSERRFSDTPVKDEDLAAILEAGRLAPTAENKQPQRILVLRDPDDLARVDLCSRCRFGAPLVLVLAFDMTAEARNPDVGDLGVIDTTIVADHMSLAAAERGVHSCWVGLINPFELRRQFDIPASYRIMGIMPMGYPSEKSRPSRLHRMRKELSETVFFDRYQTAGAEGDAPAGAAGDGAAE